MKILNPIKKSVDFVKGIFGDNSNVNVNNDNSYAFLTIGSTSDTNQNNGFDRYIGVGTCKVLAVNPTAKEIETIMGFTPKQEPVYVGTDQNGNKTARVSFIVQTIAEKCDGVDIMAFLTINLTATIIKGTTTGKIQVADEYGATAWGAEDIVNANKPIIYSNGTNPIVGTYRKICRGEINLINFFRAFLGVPNYQIYENGVWKVKTGDELKKSAFKFDNIANLFKGDFSEVKEAIALLPNNEVKLLFGVRTNDEGRTYQDVNSEEFLNARQNSTKVMEHNINDAKANGRYANTEYSFEPLHLYKIEATDFKKMDETETVDPFANSASSDNNMPF